MLISSKKHFYKNIQNNIWPISGYSGPPELIHKVNHHSAKLTFIEIVPIYASLLFTIPKKSKLLPLDSIQDCPRGFQEPHVLETIRPLESSVKKKSQNLRTGSHLNTI